MKANILLGFLCLFVFINSLYAQKRYSSYPLRDETGKVKPVKYEAEPEPNKCCFMVKPPIPLNLEEVKSKIEYPKMAKEGGITGIVVLRVLVSIEGKYVRHLITKPGHPLLLKEVEKHVSKLAFTPAMQGNKSIEYWIPIPFKFE